MVHVCEGKWPSRFEEIQVGVMVVVVMMMVVMVM